MDLHQEIRGLSPGKSRLIKISIAGQLAHLSIKAAVFKLHQQEFKLVSVQDLKTEVEASEIEAWQKLIRVLTHEIMNSVTPITSLTDTLIEILQESNARNQAPKAKDADKIFQGLRAIKDRNKALHTFTQAYQSLTKLPHPRFEEIKGNDFLKSVEALMAPEMLKYEIQLTTSSKPPGLSFTIDIDQMTQVVINLITNAAQAII